MIKSLQIQNIQSHTNSLLKFSSGVNMIIGKSDNGKSAILNALYWCMYNRPLGESHRNWDGGVMSVITTLDDGVVRITRDKQTEYLVTQNKKTKKFKAFGTDPPQEVTNLFNIDRKINFQKQLEKDAPIFLLSESPGEVAAFFNKVSGLYKIDESISRGKSDLRKTDTALQNTREQISEKQKDLEKYAGIDDLYSKVALCEQIALKCAENDQISNNLGVTLYEIGKVASNLNDLANKLYIKEKVDEAIVVQDSIRNVLVDIQTISNITNEIADRERKTRTLHEKLKIGFRIKKGQDYVRRIKENSEQKNRLVKMVKSIIDLQYKQKELKEKEECIEKEFHKLMPSKCPLCGGEV